MSDDIDTSAGWNGVPPNPERDGWHWFDRAHGVQPAWWDAQMTAWKDCDGDWHEASHAATWTHLGPCLTPAEVTAMRDASALGGWRRGIEDAAATSDAWAKMDGDIGEAKAAVVKLLGPDWPDDSTYAMTAREMAATRQYTAQGLSDAIRALSPPADLAAAAAEVERVKALQQRNIDALAELVARYGAERDAATRALAPLDEVVALLGIADTDEVTPGQAVRELQAERDAARAEAVAMRDVMQRIADMTDADDENSYRSDDREGCLDTVHAVATKALATLAREAGQ